MVDEFMKEAIEEAKKGQREGGIPIGSVLVRKGIIIGKGHSYPAILNCTYFL